MQSWNWGCILLAEITERSGNDVSENGLVAPEPPRCLFIGFAGVRHAGCNRGAVPDMCGPPVQAVPRSDTFFRTRDPPLAGLPGCTARDDLLV